MSETTLIAAEVDQCAMCRVVFGDPATEYRTVDCSEGEALWRFQAAVALGDRCKVQRLDGSGDIATFPGTGKKVSI